jgi:methyl-accepting chemotaxis protein
MSLGLRIVAAIVLLSSVLIGVLALESLSYWQVSIVADTARQIEAHSALLLDAAGSLAAERGLANGIVVTPASTSQPQRAALQAARDKADVARHQALTGLLALPGLGGRRLQTAAEAAEAAAQPVIDMRQAIDAAMAGAGTAPMQVAWFSAATTLIDAVTDLRRLIEATCDDESSISRLITVRDALAEISEYAGRERGRINGLIAADGRVSSAEMATLGAVRGRLEGGWARIASKTDLLPPPVVEAVQQAGTAMFDRFQRVRAPVMQAAAVGSAWPVSAADWFAASTQAIDAVRVAQVRIGSAIDEALYERGRTSRLDLWLVLALSGSMLGFALLALWHVRKTVIRPLKLVVAALVKLTDGARDVVIPTPKGHDEMAALLRATHRFHATAEAHRELEAGQEAMRLAADQGRVQAVREAGDLIKHESEKAISAVITLAGRLGTLADDVGGQVSAIGSAAVSASETAMQGRIDSDAAADAAEALSSAIAEVSRQMAQSSDTTRGVVSRTASTRESFAALFTSVAEVREVARMVSDIASRTNLLALNATIEAARAGDAGKGFGVVATEVKQLARQTAQSTERIAGRIGAIDQAARQAHQALDGIVGSVAALNAIADQITAAISQQTAATERIADAVGAASSGARGTADRLAAMTETTQHCLQSVAATRTISGDVAREMENLKTNLGAALHSRVAELDHRAERRTEVAWRATLRFSRGELSGQVRDISGKGARFAGDAADGDVPAFDTAQFQVAGLPPVAVCVTGQSSAGLHLAFQFASAQECEAMQAAIGRKLSSPTAAAA